MTKKSLPTTFPAAIAPSPRTIVTQYLRGHSQVRVTRSKTASAAVPNAVMHMQLNDYDAFTCQVWDEATGELHAVIKRGVTGNLTILFSRVPVRGE